MKKLSRSTAEIPPVRIVQFGEGNFLRAFIDWMIQELNRKTAFRSSVQIVQVLKDGIGQILNEQDGLYTLILRGVQNGQRVENIQLVKSVRGCINAVTEWELVRQLFRTPELRFSFSNTTEAGIEYKPENYTPGLPQTTFPAKVAALLFDRFQAGLPGLIFLPCELIEQNGTALKKCILRYAEDWQTGTEFIRYIDEENIFCRTLVDRIVAGYPRTEAADICCRLGYEDKLLVCAEPFHFFVIEAPECAARELPFADAGLNVVYVKDQTPYRTRKVRFLNGAHTATIPAAYLAGFDLVDEVVADPLFGRYVRTALFEEIFPTVPLPDNEKRAFAEAMLERFANPFAMHRLLSIALNSVSKWKVRVLPSLLDYQKMNGSLPKILTFSLAALIAFYRNKDGIGLSRVNSYPVQDDPEIVSFFAEHWQDIALILGRMDYWGMDLNTVPGLAEQVGKYLNAIMENGIRLAVGEVLA